MIQEGRLVKLHTPEGKDLLLPQRVYGRSCIGRNFEFLIDAIHTSATLRPRSQRGQPVTLWIQQSDGSYMPHNGYVSSVTKLGTDGGAHMVQLAVTSWLHFLRFRSDARNWQEVAVDGILADVFAQHRWIKRQYRFELLRKLKPRPFVQQYEDDWNFVHRLLEEEGLFYYFEHAPDGSAHTMVIVDDVGALPAANPERIAFQRDHQRFETDGVTHWEETDALYSTQLTGTTSDYRETGTAAWLRKTTVPADDADQLPWSTEIYEYAGPIRTADEQRRRDAHAVFRVEHWESAAQRMVATGGVRGLDAGRWFELVGHPERGERDPAQDWQYIAIETRWGIENNLPVSVATREMTRSLKSRIEALKAEHIAGYDGDPAALAVRHGDGGTGWYSVQIEAQRRNLPYRSPMEHRKPVMHLQVATVVGPENEEVFTDELNRIRVRFHWDRINGDTLAASCWVRVAFADAGKGRGTVNVPRVGEEVLIGWENGDCDHPVAISRLHTGTTQPPWHSNGILSGLRSREYGGRGYNQLVLDDATGQVGARLASSSAGAHVHLGYLIDHSGNNRGSYLGSGFDLKSDAWGALRAGRGLYVSTHPIAQQPLDARPANSQLTNAARLVDALSSAGAARKAESLQEGHEALTTFADATVHTIEGSTLGGRTAGGGTGNANAFAKPVMLLASPAGIGLSTQQSVHVAGDAHVNVVSGQSTHIATGRSLLASITEKFTLFVQNAGMKSFAAKGDVQLQAQDGNIDLAAQQAVRLASVANNIELAAKKDIVLTAGGGAYIRIAGNDIEIHAPGKVDIRGAQHALSGPAQMKRDHPAFPVNMPTTPLMLNTAASPAASGCAPVGMPYKLLADGVEVKQGVIDASGQIPVDHYPTTQQYSVQFANGVSHDIPVPADYRDRVNGALANLGLHFHEAKPGTDAGNVDRAVHRQHYAAILNLDIADQGTTDV